MLYTHFSKFLLWLQIRSTSTVGMNWSGSWLPVKTADKHEVEWVWVWVWVECLGWRKLSYTSDMFSLALKWPRRGGRKALLK